VPTLTLLAAGTYGPQTIEFPSQTIVQSLSTADIVMTRNSWPNIGGEVVQIRADVSLDGGVNWQTLIGFGTWGGPPNTESRASTSIPAQRGATLRRVRGTINLLATLNTQAQLIVN
jgi:hypothetical protein